jgi:hypothetical protein
MWCQKDLIFEFTDQEDVTITDLLHLSTAGGTEPATNRTWPDIANAMNSGATSRKYNHRSIYARYTLYLAPGCTQESREIGLHAAGLVGASENLPFPQLSQLQQSSGNVIEWERERLPPLQRENPGPPPLRRVAEPFVERLVVGPPRSFEENMRNRKAEGGVEGGGLRWKGKGKAGD